MITRILSLILVSVLFFSCTEEDVVPRTTPRFSVAFVQEIDAKGAEFAANMYDYGSEEIEEFGFIYSESQNLRIETSEIVKQTGRPEDQFKLKAMHSMVQGQKYFVAAFLKTRSGIIYSKPYNFTSQGSEGFIFERIESPESVYFGDTVTIYGKNLSREFSKYSATVQNQAANVLNLTEESFQVILPNSLPIETPNSNEILLEFGFKIAGKSITISKPVKFKEPVIFPYDVIEVSYTDEFIIKGDYLFSNQSEAVLLDGKDGSVIVPASYYDNAIIFKPQAAFADLNPTFQVTVRGKVFTIENRFRLKPTLVKSNQFLKVKTGEEFEIEGENINPHFPNNHQLVFEPDAYLGFSKKSTSGTLTNTYDFKGSNASRKFKVFLKTAGVISADYFEIEVGNPGIPVNYLYNRFDQSPNFIDAGEFALLMRDGSLYKYEPNNFSQSAYYSFAGNEVPINNSFLIQKGDKAYLGKSFYPFYQYPSELRVFDTKTNTSENLPIIPSKVVMPEACFILGEYLYFLRGRIPNQIPSEPNNSKERYKFNLNSKTWEKLPDANGESYFHPFSVFEYDSKVFAITREKKVGEAIRSRLVVFNPIIEDWEMVKELPVQNLISHHNVKIGNRLFLEANIDGLYFDLNSFTYYPWLKKTPYQYYDPFSMFKVGDKLYQVTRNGNLYEFDLNYF